MGNTRQSRKGKFELIRAVAKGDNDPTPQLGYYNWFSAWVEFRLPGGCVIRSITDATKMFYSIGCGRFVDLSVDEYQSIISRPAQSAPTVVTGVSGWSVKRDSALGLMSGGA